MPASIPAEVLKSQSEPQEHRQRLIAAMPVVERRMVLAGVPTAVLLGGRGTPVILLHGPMGYAAHWLRVAPELASLCQIVAPDLPGHGASDAADVLLGVDGVVKWLGELIDRTCTSPPVLVGKLLGGAIALRFACKHGDRIRRLVLADTFGLSAFAPPAAFAGALGAFQRDPTTETHRDLWQYCAYDLNLLRARMGTLWEPFEAYDIERARIPSVSSSVQALLSHFGPPIPAENLERIAVPTRLIWGRHDRATPVAVAEAASARYGWPLTIIERAADDPSIEQPEDFLSALRHDIGAQP